MVSVSSVEHCKESVHISTLHPQQKTFFSHTKTTGHFVSSLSFLRRESVFFSDYPAACVSLLSIWKKISNFHGRWNEVCTPEGVIKLSEIRHNMADAQAIPSSRRVHQEMNTAYRSMPCKL
jgi:hypothetical protein